MIKQSVARWALNTIHGGRKWDRPMAITETLPVMAESVLNGVAH